MKAIKAITESEKCVHIGMALTAIDENMNWMSNSGKVKWFLIKYLSQ